jgi:putative transcriptional regulator
MVRHDKDGALGIVINRPVGERPLTDILGADDKDAAGNVRIFWGGPVELQMGFVIHSADYRKANTLDIDGRVAMTSNREILHDIARNSGPQKSLIAFGYAGWGPGQLEGEIASRGWYTAPASQSLIFDEDREKVWDLAVAQRTRDL